MIFAAGYRNYVRRASTLPQAESTSENNIKKRVATGSNTKQGGTEMSRTKQKLGTVSRRTLLRAGAGLAGRAALPPALTMPAFAVGIGDKPPIGTWPVGSEGDMVSIGAAVPRTGTYAVQGEDELKGWQLAVEHINNGNPLLQKIAPKVSKGLLGKK